MPPHLARAGNDLSRTFNWGAEFLWRWLDGYGGLYKTLKRVGGSGGAKN